MGAVKQGMIGVTPFFVEVVDGVDPAVVTDNGYLFLMILGEIGVLLPELVIES